MNTATALAEIAAPLPVEDFDSMVEESIVRFLSGETDGEDLFNALYGHMLEEPIPAEMLELVRTGELSTG
ncbi:MAG TPA: hypothetical protein VLV50_18520 [Stellaceae bacterium]|nr:hypothetical protein [Stellaceae bacterium]